MIDLDSLWEEVSGLGSVFGGSESRAQLGDDVLSGVQCLEEKSEGSKHSKTAVLDLLELLLSVFLGGVVDVERVPSSGVCKSNISRDAVLALLLDALNTLVLNPSHTSDNLVDGKAGNVVDGLKRVDVRVSIGTSEVLVTGEGSEKSRPDESNNGKLSDTSVGELGLTKPLNISHEVSLLVDGVVEGGEGSGGESNGVETNISDERSIEGGWSRSERKGTGSFIP